MSRPRPRGEVGGCPGSHPAGPGPHLERVFRPIPGGVSRPRPKGCIPACTEADTPCRRLLLRAVRILLECIVVTDKRAKKKLKCNCMQLDFCRKA